MGKFLFMFLVFSGILFAQLTNIPVVGSTDDLSASYGRGLIILNNLIDGGFFLSVDSAYAETGTYAYPHPVVGRQWVRLGYSGDAMGTFNNLTVNGTLGVTGMSTLSRATLGANYPSITFPDGDTLTFAAGANNMMYLRDVGTTSDLTISGDVRVNGGDLDLLTSPFDFNIVNTGTINFKDDATNTLVSIADGGTLGTVSMGSLTTASNGTIQLRLFDNDADGGQQPYWYLQNANNGSKGVLYLGYTNTSNNISTDVMLVDSVSFTLGSVIGTGTKTLYTGSIGAHTMAGSTTAADSSTSVILKDSAGMKWKIKVNTQGVVSADSTGLN